MKRNCILASLALALCTQSLPADVISYPIAGSATFGTGIFGTFDFTFSSGPTGLYLEQLAIQLPSTVRFDTAPGGFGAFPFVSLDIGGFQGTDVSTGLYEISPGTGAILDGGRMIAFSFLDFTAGKSFHFTGDVDVDCSGKTGFALLACNATASVVTAQQFSGATATFTFGGPGFDPVQVTSPFEPQGGLRFFSSVNEFEAEVVPNPEPATFVFIGTGLLLGSVLHRRRRAFGKK
jgi:hypothetical protein